MLSRVPTAASQRDAIAEEAVAGCTAVGTGRSSVAVVHAPMGTACMSTSKHMYTCVLVDVYVLCIRRCISLCLCPCICISADRDTRPVVGRGLAHADIPVAALLVVARELHNVTRCTELPTSAPGLGHICIGTWKHLHRELSHIRTGFDHICSGPHLHRELSHKCAGPGHGVSRATSS